MMNIDLFVNTQEIATQSNYQKLYDYINTSYSKYSNEEKAYYLTEEFRLKDSIGGSVWEKSTVNYDTGLIAINYMNNKEFREEHPELFSNNEMKAFVKKHVETVFNAFTAAENNHHTDKYCVTSAEDIAKNRLVNTFKQEIFGGNIEEGYMPEQLQGYKEMAKFWTKLLKAGQSSTPLEDATDDNIQKIVNESRQRNREIFNGIPEYTQEQLNAFENNIYDNLVKSGITSITCDYNKNSMLDEVANQNGIKLPLSVWPTKGGTSFYHSSSERAFVLSVEVGRNNVTTPITVPEKVSAAKNIKTLKS